MNILSNTLINTKHIRGLNINTTRSECHQSPIDMDIENYSVDDILTIFNLVDVDEASLFQIKDVANNLIARMKSEGKMDMAIFFEKAKQKVITELAREDDDDDSDSSDDDHEVSHYDNKMTISNASLMGDNWWENDAPIKSQHSREAPQQINSNHNHNQNNSNKQMLEYEKNIILEKLRMTEIKMREIEKENKKLKKQIKLLSDK